MTTIPDRKPSARALQPAKVVSPICEVCLIERPVVHGELPGLSVRASRCRECQEAGAVPWWMLVAQSHDANMLAGVDRGWARVVQNTLDHLDVSAEMFERAVQDYARGLGAHSRRQP